jgi:TetR/AcrR family tetracycline transcriptional repressor
VPLTAELRTVAAARDAVDLPRCGARGLPTASAAAGADVVTGYANGFTIEEQARKTAQARATRDAGFDLGLTVIIAGLRALR